MAWKAIKPAKDPFSFATASKLTAALLKSLSDFGFEAQARLSQYPDSQTSYTRTGTLGRGWTKQGPTAGKFEVKVGNKTEYAAPVQGPQQVETFAAYGWVNTTQVLDEVWPKYKGRISASLQGK